MQELVHGLAADEIAACSARVDPRSRGARATGAARGAGACHHKWPKRQPGADEVPGKWGELGGIPKFTREATSPSTPPAARQPSASGRGAWPSSSTSAAEWPPDHAASSARTCESVRQISASVGPALPPEVAPEPAGLARSRAEALASAALHSFGCRRSESSAPSVPHRSSKVAEERTSSTELNRPRTSDSHAPSSRLTMA
eukprot:scaffold131301_cov32-Tisochrysis_lutea.AAC.2